MTGPYLLPSGAGPAAGRFAIGAPAVAPAAVAPAQPTPAHVSLIELMLVVLLLLWRFIGGLGTVDFHPDESQWIATSAALEAFVSADFGAPSWKENYWTLTHPPLARYLIGLGRRAGGYAVGDLNRPWRWGDDFATNQRAGSLPTQRLLWYARVPMALLAAGSGAIGFVLLINLAGRIAAYGWAIAFAGNPYLSPMLSRAMSDSALVCAVLAVTLLGWATMMRATRLSDTRSAQRLAGWLGLTALASGIAAAAKLTGAAMFLPLLALAIAVAVRLHRHLQLADRWCVLLVVLVAGAAAVPFVVLNPYLYSDPLTRTLHMLEQRGYEMHLQEMRYPETRMPTGLEWGRRIGTRVFHDYAPVRLDDCGLVNAALCALGVLWTLSTARLRRRWPQARYAATAILAAAGVNALPVFLSRLDWDRYYLLPEVFAMMFAAVGFARLVDYPLARVAWRTPAGRTVFSPTSEQVVR